jgi:hypothetical protein
MVQYIAASTVNLCNNGSQLYIYIYMGGVDENAYHNHKRRKLIKLIKHTKQQN